MSVPKTKAQGRIRQRNDAQRQTGLVSETINGVEIEYYSLGKYVVAQPDVCGGRPTIKNTRIDARAIIGALRRGDSPDQIATAFRIPVEAITEAVELSNQYDYERSYA